MEDTREIIPVEHEEAETKKADAESGFQMFLSEFSVEKMPACPVGMRLLYAFGVSAPSLYRMAERGDFQNVPSPVEMSAKWNAYSTHVQTCADCNER